MGTIELLTVLIECLIVLLKYINLFYCSHKAYQTSRRQLYELDAWERARPVPPLATPLMSGKLKSPGIGPNCSILSHILCISTKERQYDAPFVSKLCVLLMGQFSTVKTDPIL